MAQPPSERAAPQQPAREDVAAVIARIQAARAGRPTITSEEILSARDQGRRG